MINLGYFVLKVWLGSAVLSWLIKYVGPSLGISDNLINVLILIFTPSLMMGMMIWWRFTNNSNIS